MTIEELLNNPELLEVGRKAVEDCLIERRDARISLLGAGNGLTIREKNGESHGIIRMTVPEALRIALTAILEHIAAKG